MRSSVSRGRRGRRFGSGVHARSANCASPGSSSSDSARPKGDSRSITSALAKWSYGVRVTSRAVRCRCHRANGYETSTVASGWVAERVADRVARGWRGGGGPPPSSPFERRNPAESLHVGCWHRARSSARFRWGPPPQRRAPTRVTLRRGRRAAGCWRTASVERVARGAATTCSWPSPASCAAGALRGDATLVPRCERDRALRRGSRGGRSAHLRAPRRWFAQPQRAATRDRRRRRVALRDRRHDAAVRRAARRRGGTSRW